MIGKMWLEKITLFVFSGYSADLELRYISRSMPKKIKTQIRPDQRLCFRYIDKMDDLFSS